ncbi:MAG: spore coat associated protein CotJA [Ruminococcus sp.]|nr:spore coat associated protein CotJA [Ruminococcus sp.]
MPQFPSSTPLAMAYVPFQNWGETKSAEEALECGTLFSELVYPFERGGGSK